MDTVSIRLSDDVTKIKFLMNMFEGMVINPANGTILPYGASQFKQVLASMVAQNQISQDIASVVESIYGIENTSTFKPSVQQEKVGQIKNIMQYIEGMINNGRNGSEILSNLEEMVKSKLVTRTAKEVAVSIYFEAPKDTSWKRQYKQRQQAETIVSSKYTFGIIDKTLFTGKELTSNDLSKYNLEQITKLKHTLETIAERNSKINGEQRVCQVYKDIAYLETSRKDTDPCRGGLIYSRTPIKEVANLSKLPSGARIVYRCDNSDACRGDTYESLESLISRQLRLVEYHFRKLFD